MKAAVYLSEQLVNTAKTYAFASHRSMAKQIEHWSEIGRIAEENPDLSFHDIQTILLGLAALKTGEVSEYKKGMLSED